MTTTAAAPAAASDRFGVPLKGWSFAPSLPEVDDLAVIAACEMCGDTFFTEDGGTLCTACGMPPAEVAALRMVPAPARAVCETCGFFPLAANTVRCTACTRLYASLTALAATRKEDAIAA
jgi:hypothetical protein